MSYEAKLKSALTAAAADQVSVLRCLLPKMTDAEWESVAISLRLSFHAGLNFHRDRNKPEVETVGQYPF